MRCAFEKNIFNFQARLNGTGRGGQASGNQTLNEGLKHQFWFWLF